MRSTWFLALATVLVRKTLKWKSQPGDPTPIEASEDGQTETGTGTESDVPVIDDGAQEHKDDDVRSGKVAPVSLRAGGRRRKVVRKR